MSEAIHRHNELHCRKCGEAVDSAMNTEDGSAAPEDGSWSICVYCATISRYVVGPFGVALRAPTEQERDTFLREQPELLETVKRYIEERYYER